MKVLIVDDHELLAETLRLSLSAEGYEAVVAGIDPAEVFAVARAERPDVVLLDLDLGAAGDGSALVADLVKNGARVVVVSGTTDRHRLAACLEHGAWGYVSKAAALDELLDAVRRTSEGLPLVSAAERLTLLADLRRYRHERHHELEPFAELTEREQYILAQVMEGRSAADIAAIAYVSEATVRTQIRGVLTKLGVRSQLAAAAVARRAGWSYQRSAD